MIVVGSGARDYTKQVVVDVFLDWVDLAYGITRISEGKQTGADTLIRHWRERHGKDGRSYEAYWTTLKKAAGPERNKRMIEAEHPDMWIGFEGGKGTANCMSQALALPYCRIIHVATAQVCKDRVDLTVSFHRLGHKPKLAAMSLLRP